MYEHFSEQKQNKQKNDRFLFSIFCVSRVNSINKKSKKNFLGNRFVYFLRVAEGSILFFIGSSNTKGRNDFRMWAAVCEHESVTRRHLKHTAAKETSKGIKFYQIHATHHWFQLSYLLLDLRIAYYLPNTEFLSMSYFGL